MHFALLSRHRQPDCLSPHPPFRPDLPQPCLPLPSPPLIASCLPPGWCRQAVALNPGHFRAYKLMGSALYALGDFEGAKAALKESLKWVGCAVVEVGGGEEGA